MGAGVPASTIKDVYCVTKAYSSCVGAGPFTTELFGEEAKELRDPGAATRANTAPLRAVRAG